MLSFIIINGLELVVVVLAKETHVARDAHEHVLRDVDLHQYEKLVKSSEHVADGRKVDPLVALHAQQVLVRTRLVLPVDNEVARGDGHDRDEAEDEVSDEQALGLLLEKLRVEPEAVFRHLGQLLLSLHVAVAGQEDIEDLVGEDEYRHGDKIARVNRFMTVFHPEGGDEEGDSGGPHAHSEGDVDHAKLARAPLRVVQHRVDNDVEGEEEGELREEKH